MKRFAVVPMLVFLISVLIWGAGCQNAGPVEPASMSASQTPQFIALPKNNSLHKLISATEVITPQNGGTLRLNYDYGSGTSRVNIDISLNFPSGAVTENTAVTLTVDDAVLMTNIDLSFGPQMKFLKPGLLDVNAKGLDLSGVPSNATVRFYYYNNGAWEEIPVKRISVDLSQGKVECRDGEISHFSRYAFGF
jgi:hypothetical protein